MPLPISTSSEGTRRKSRHFQNEQMLENQHAWLGEVGALPGTDVWETVTATMVRKGYYTQDEADAYTKVDKINRSWREARRANCERGIIVLSSENGYRQGTEEEYTAHDTPLEIAAKTYVLL